MPMGGQPLPAEKIDLVRRWIATGAAWPETSAAKLPDPKKHWAFVPPVRPAAPRTSRPDWVRNPVDSICARSGLDRANH